MFDIDLIPVHTRTMDLLTKCHLIEGPLSFVQAVDWAGAAKDLCGWLLHSKTFFDLICVFFRSSHVSGLFARF